MIVGASLVAVGSMVTTPEIYGSGQHSRLQVERIGSEHGLAHNAVRAILEDAQGFLWFGTEDGLQRFDGLDFETFRAGLPPLELSHSRVQALLEAVDGSLWIGTASGLDVLSPDRASLRRVFLETSHESFTVSSLSISPDGDIGVGTTDHGLLVTAIAGDGAQVLRPLTPPSWEILDHGWLPDGGVSLLRSLDGVWSEVWLDSDLLQSEVLPLPEAGEIADSFDRAKHGSRDRAHRQAWVFLSEGRWLWRTSLETEGDHLWMGGVQGLFARSAMGGEVVEVSLGGAEWIEGGLAQEILSLERDHAGTLWIGTYGGLFKADPARRGFVAMPRGSSPGKHAISSFSTSRRKPGQLLAGTFGGGLLELSLPDRRLQRRVSLHERSGGRCSDFVWSVAENEQVLVVVTDVAICSFRSDGELIGVIEGSYRQIESVADASFWVSGIFNTLKLAPSGELEARFEVIAEALYPISNTEVWLATPVGSGTPAEASLVRLNAETGDKVAISIPRQLSIFDFTKLELEGIESGKFLLATTDGLLSFEVESGVTQVEVSASLTGTVYVLVKCTRKPADRTVCDGPGDGLHGFEVPPAGNRETGLDHIHAHALQRLGDSHLFIPGHGGPGTLLTIA